MEIRASDWRRVVLHYFYAKPLFKYPPVDNTWPVIETEGPKRPNWLNISFLVLTPILSVVLLTGHIRNSGFAWVDFAIFATMCVITSLATTAGYHRYYSHRAYDCHPVVEFFFLIFGAASFQNSLLHWASDHRYHHRHVDHDADPYSIKKGFFWAHIGWIFFDDMPGARTFSNVEDLKKNRLVMWQHRYYFPLAVVFGLGFPLLVGAALGHAWGGFLWGGLARIVVVHHSIFLVNSAAHVFGTQPHSSRNSAKDNWLMSFFTYGEGFHNYHHAYPSDYRNGVKWYHWDPTKWLIATIGALGLAWRLKRVNSDPR